MSKQFVLISFIFMVFSINLVAQDYVVQIAAYSEVVPLNYFEDKDLKGVYKETDHNNITRYYLGPFVDDTFAKRVEAKARQAGFQYARVVNKTAIREQCALSCGSLPNTGEFIGDPNAVLGVDDLFIRNLFFDFDRSNLRTSSTNELDKLYSILQDNPTYQVELHGHTDWKGSEEYNQSLSLRRAHKARNYLNAKGINKNRLIVKPFGEREPVALNESSDGRDSEIGRQLNRRVELRIIDETGQILWDKVEEIAVPEELKVD